MPKSDSPGSNKLSELHEKGIVQTVSPDPTISNQLMRNSMNSRFIKSNESVGDKHIKIKCNSSMSQSPNSHTITPASFVKSSFGTKKKRLIFGTKVNTKGMK